MKRDSAPVDRLSVEALRPFTKVVDEKLQLDLFLKGVRCGHCVHKIEKALNSEENLSRYQFQEDGHNLQISAPRVEDLAKIISLISQLGFEAIPIQEGEDHKQKILEFKKALKQLAVAGVCAGNIMLFSTAIYLGAPENFRQFFNGLSMLLVAPVLFYSAQPIWRGFGKALRHLQFNLDVPIALALVFGTSLSVVSYFTGGESLYFDSIAVVVFIILSSRFLLNQYVSGIYRRNLVTLIPGVFQARVFRQGKAQFVAPSDLNRGEEVILYRGESCPVDGELISEVSVFDHAVISGEAEPLSLSRGDKVYAGAKLCQGEARVRVSRVGDQTRVGQIVSAALSSVKTGDEVGFRYVQWFTLFVLSSSFLGFLYFLITAGPALAFERSFALVIVACPCAISFGLPLIQFLSGRLCLKNSMLVKDPSKLHQLKNINQVCFDKTGTVTEPKVVVNKEDLFKFSERQRQQVLALELSIDHPISNGFKAFVDGNEELPAVTDFTYLPGRGIEGQVLGQKVSVLATDAGAQGEKFLSVVIDDQAVGKIGVSSDVKLSFQPLLQFLARQQKKISIISGDQAEQIEPIWKLVPKEARHQCLASVTPEEKKVFIKNISGPSLMVGDGVNDVAALNAATVGVSMPGALESNQDFADVALLKGDLTLIQTLFTISDKVNATHRRLFTFTAVYNSLCVILALMGWITPVWAAILMPVSSVTVIALVTTRLGVRPWK
ncbi:MAG: heavy metal translocating P-type ATPase [Bdellovibrionales bacterium]|nr:heavy metal translocating P-type ATPase [Bdellovibrionales bacterium]